MSRKYPPHHNTTSSSLSCGPMLSCYLCQILTLPCKYRSINKESSCQVAFFSNLLLSNFGEHMQVCFSQLTGRLDMLCLHRSSSPYLGCNKWLLELLLLLPSLPQTFCPFSSDLQHQHHPFTQRTASNWIFSLFWTIIRKHQRRVCGKILIDQQ